jgi:hypothetical protein
MLDTLEWDGITAAYGGGSLNVALSAGAYVAEDSELIRLYMVKS